VEWTVVDWQVVGAVCSGGFLLGVILTRAWGMAGGFAGLIAGPVLCGVATFVRRTLTSGSQPLGPQFVYFDTTYVVVTAVLGFAAYWCLANALAWPLGLWWRTKRRPSRRP
jgi:hypothetical protein